MSYSKVILKSAYLAREYAWILLLSFSAVRFWTHCINLLLDHFVKYWDPENTEVDA